MKPTLQQETQPPAISHQPRIVVITSDSKEIAEALISWILNHQPGVKVAWLCRFTNAKQSLKPLLHQTKNEGRFLYFRMDPSRAGWLKRAAQSIHETWGRVGTVISISDFSTTSSIETVSYHQMKQVLRRNIFVPTAFVHAMLPVITDNANIILVPPPRSTAPSLNDSISRAALEALASFTATTLVTKTKASVTFIDTDDLTTNAEITKHIISKVLLE